MAIIEIARIQVRRGQENTTGVPRLEPGELGWAEDTQHLYIGKRITEGAVNNDNTRILTEVDLPGILDSLNHSTTQTQTTLYRYRAFTNTNYIRDFSKVRLLQDKLDETVSIYDFMTGSPSTTTNIVPTDITIELNTAIQTLFNNPANPTDARRALKIPAGNYMITNSRIDLPPKTILVGEGKGLTTLILNSPSNSMFRTVDAYGIGFGDIDLMALDDAAAGEISISDMTISYNDGNINTDPLVSIDNARNVRIHNVGFTTMNADLSNPTLVSTGTAIAIQGNLGVDEGSLVCRNISVTECSIENVSLGINLYGKVTGAIIENNIFNNLQQGMYLSALNSSFAPPVNTTVHNNKFRFVISEAIAVDVSTFNTNLISSNNSYHYVGNGSATPDDNLNAPALPVLLFNAPGNTSVDDFFNRKVTKDTLDGTDYYNPLVMGSSRINNSTVYTKTIGTNSADQRVVRIPLTGADQVGYIDYQLSNVDMSRKGRLILNISSDGYAAVSDYYSYSELVTDSSLKLLFSTGLDQAESNNFITLTCTNESTTATTQLEYSLDLMV